MLKIKWNHLKGIEKNVKNRIFSAYNSVQGLQVYEKFNCVCICMYFFEKCIEMSKIISLFYGFKHILILLNNIIY